MVLEKQTNVIPLAFIKGCGFDLLKQCVRSGMAIEQEPYFGSVTIYYNSHLKQSEINNVGSTQNYHASTLCQLSAMYLSMPCFETYMSERVPVSLGVQWC